MASLPSTSNRCCTCCRRSSRYIAHLLARLGTRCGLLVNVVAMLLKHPRLFLLPSLADQCKSLHIRGNIFLALLNYRRRLTDQLWSGRVVLVLVIIIFFLAVAGWHHSRFRVLSSHRTRLVFVLAVTGWHHPCVWILSTHTRLLLLRLLLAIAGWHHPSILVLPHGGGLLLILLRGTALVPLHKPLPSTALRLAHVCGSRQRRIGRTAAAPYV
mmetsp:Transcript_14745/g.31629  ORF Transcript_14745/g.31629 Transcript_14745/m.31629 type:complete len:213 (+) Transcript_14745:95-733(+)